MAVLALRPTLAVALAGALLPLFSSPSHAGWPFGSATTVSVCAAQNDQAQVAIDTDGAGGAIVVWSDLRGSGADVYAQRLGAGGTPLWTADGVVVCGAGGAQVNPVIASDGAGGAFLVWTDARILSNDIYAQRLNAAGVPQWTANGVVVCSDGANQGPAVAVADGLGGVLIAWEDYRNGVSDLFYQGLDASGTARFTPDGNAFCVAAGAQNGLVAAADGIGGIVMAWTDGRSGPNTDIYATRISQLGTIFWSGNGAPVCTNAATQAFPRIALDGTGGAIIAWEDYRNFGTGDVYADRYDLFGASQWGPDGVQVTSLIGQETDLSLCSDDAGGAYVAWKDSRSASLDLYAQHLDSFGAASWGANGIAVCTAAGTQDGARAVGDGLGGVILTWRDNRSLNQTDLYAQHSNSAGAAFWNANGLAVSRTTASVSVPTGVVSDGSGGAIAAWVHTPQAFDADIHAHRVDQWGQLGAQPNIVGLEDVPNDQGGQLKVSWTASGLDLFPSYSIQLYRVFRSVPPNAVADAVRTGATLARAEDLGGAPHGRTFIATGAGAGIQYWEYVGSQTASHLPGYSMVVPTTGDSIGGSNPPTLSMVQAWDLVGRWWNSDPDSGYSVDDLPPAPPEPFTGAYLVGDTHLHWDPNREADLAGYRVYRGTTPDFVPGSGNLIASPSDTGYVDAGAGGYHYKLSAVDAHGNESGFTLLTPGETLDVPNRSIPGRVVLAQARPNPATEGTQISFALPRAGEVRLALYDAQGRQVRELIRGTRGAGEHSVRWEGRDDAGRRVASGVYLIRLEAAGTRHTGRVGVVW